MCAQPKAAEGISPEELQEVLDRLDSLAMKISGLACLPPVSDEAFRALDDVPRDNENSEATHMFFKQLCELLKRHGSHRAHA